MKKVFSRSALLLTFFLSIVGGVSGHPLDVSNTSLTVIDSRILGVTYIHPVQIDRILIERGSVGPHDISVEKYYSLSGVIASYLAERILLSNDGKSCTISDFAFQDGMMIDEIFTSGFPVSYTFDCGGRVIHPQVTMNFMTEVPLQTNKLYVYINRDGDIVRTDYRVLNAKKNIHNLSLSPHERFIDTDADSISDEDEVLYGTRIDNPDTDSDGYNDGIEISKSWNPLSSELSPGQEQYSGDHLQNDSVPTQSSENTLGSTDNGIWAYGLFSKVLREIRMYIDKEVQSNGILAILILVFSLGFFHALGPGHSKGILISQVIDTRMHFFQVLLYCLIFSIIHILDIVIVVVLSRFYFHFFDSTDYLGFISKISAILVFIIGAYLLYRSVKKYRNYEKVSEDPNMSSTKRHILLAMITGLAPCAFGWSIFLMLIALGKSTLAIPLLLSLGLGIFCCLLCIASITWFMRERVYHWSPRVSLISPVLSSAFLFLIGSGLLIGTL